MFLVTFHRRITFVAIDWHGCGRLVVLSSFYCLFFLLFCMLSSSVVRLLDFLSSVLTNCAVSLVLMNLDPITSLSFSVDDPSDEQILNVGTSKVAAASRQASNLWSLPCLCLVTFSLQFDVTFSCCVPDAPRDGLA